MCQGAKWKREVVPDHKFDFVDVREFTDNGFGMRMKYLWLFIVVLKSFLVYVTDIFTAITMLTTRSWSNQIFENCSKDTNCISIPYNTGKWLFVGCIIFSFLLLGYESRKSKKIIASRDISYAFTNVMANNYYSLRSYDHFCFFDHISSSTKTSDDFAFFVFFVFKSWKRVLLADGPRQTINALTLYAIWLTKHNKGPWYDVTKYFSGNTLSTSALTMSTFFTVVVFAGSLGLLIVAGICYIPLLCHIRGNLKEYCCHKVDKRIGTVIKRRQKKRLEEAAKLAQKEAMGDYSHLKNKKGEFIAKPLPQPTLPNLSVDDDVDDKSSIKTRQPPPSTYTQDSYYYYNSDKSADYPPPMPAYNPYSTHQPAEAYAQFNSSQATLQDDSYYHSQHMYEEDNESTANLPMAAAPFGQQHMDRPGSAGPTNPYMNQPGSGGSYDPHDVYQGRGVPSPDNSRRPSPLGSSSGLAYDDDAQDYPPQPAYGSQGMHQSGYSGAPAAPPQQGRWGRGYDEENRGGSQAM